MISAVSPADRDGVDVCFMAIIGRGGQSRERPARQRAVFFVPR
jgi:hypothetical protein